MKSLRIKRSSLLMFKLLEEIYNWTRYKETPWAIKTKEVLDYIKTGNTIHKTPSKKSIAKKYSLLLKAWRKIKL